MPSLYLHIPFCRRKCPYCDFYSVSERAEALADYPGMLCRHLEIAEAGGWRGPFQTIFFGGGTPSLLSPRAIGEILQRAAALFGLHPAAEITLEANPGTLTRESLVGYRKAGVNRLSLGVQSLHDRFLALLGRTHSAAQARQALQWARQAGFEDISLDLMFALPHQSPRDLHLEIDAFLQMEPDHLSCYGLGIEEETPFGHRHREGGLPLPDEELYALFFQELHHRLGEAGYRHYEISNYARPGRRCRHNLVYWRRGSYLGVGAGAHSFAASGWGVRRAVPADLEAFARTLHRGEDPAHDLELFDRSGAMAETLYLGLRTDSGVSERDFRERFGTGVAEAFPDAVRKADRRLHLEDGRWRFDLQGWLLYDHLIAHFL